MFCDFWPNVQNSIEHLQLNNLAIRHLGSRRLVIFKFEYAETVLGTAWFYNFVKSPKPEELSAFKTFRTAKHSKREADAGNRIHARHHDSIHRNFYLITFIDPITSAKRLPRQLIASLGTLLPSWWMYVVLWTRFELFYQVLSAPKWWIFLEMEDLWRRLPFVSRAIGTCFFF